VPPLKIHISVAVLCRERERFGGRGDQPTTPTPGASRKSTRGGALKEEDVNGGRLSKACRSFSGENEVRDSPPAAGGMGGIGGGGGLIGPREGTLTFAI